MHNNFIVVMGPNTPDRLYIGPFDSYESAHKWAISTVWFKHGENFEVFALNPPRQDQVSTNSI